MTTGTTTWPCVSGIAFPIPRLWPTATIRATLRGTKVMQRDTLTEYRIDLCAYGPHAKRLPCIAFMGGPTAVLTEFHVHTHTAKSTQAFVHVATQNRNNVRAQPFSSRRTMIPGRL